MEAETRINYVHCPYCHLAHEHERCVYDGAIYTKECLCGKEFKYKIRVDVTFEPINTEDIK